jgi:hypothetical protein
MTEAGRNIVSVFGKSNKTWQGDMSDFKIDR